MEEKVVCNSLHLPNKFQKHCILQFSKLPPKNQERYQHCINLTAENGWNQYAYKLVWCSMHLDKFQVSEADSKVRLPPFQHTLTE